MEITDRPDLGSDLFAPIADSAGRPYWGYELITYVQPGDVVLHWHKTLRDEPGIVGWSQATGTYEDTDISWQARARARSKGITPEPRPAWRMPLLNYTPLANPVDISDVRGLDSDLRAVQAELEKLHPNTTLYFPFGFSDKRELRAQQTYFVKMPRKVLDVLGLADLEASPAPARKAQEGKAGKRSGSGYLADSAVRSAIEWRAVNLATENYESLGYVVKYTGSSKPYDLEASREGEVRRVEVKGSSGAAETVELTVGEVLNSRDDATTDLYVVDGIRWTRLPDGGVGASGGEIRWWPDWSAEEDRLRATRFRYELPDAIRDLSTEPTDDS